MKKALLLFEFYESNMRSPGFEPELPAWEADVLDQAGRRPLTILEGLTR